MYACKRLKVFVGSCSEAEKIDRSVRATLEKLGVDVIGWRDAFPVGSFTLEAIIQLSCQVDAALLIVTPDDLAQVRGAEKLTARDNVILEIGVFISRLGRNRTAIIHVQKPDKVAAILPTDLNGLTVWQYKENQKIVFEEWIDGWLDGVGAALDEVDPEIQRVSDLLTTVFSSSRSAWRPDVQQYITDPLKNTLKLAEKGEIVLTVGQYYNAIFEEIDAAKSPAQIIGVARLTSSFWVNNKDQEKYLQKNIAAVRRGALIRRLFIATENDMSNYAPVLKKMVASGMSVRMARVDYIRDATSLEDMVVFLTPGSQSHLYIADGALDNPSRIRRGRLILNSHHRERAIKEFEQVWASSEEVSLGSISNIQDSSNIAPAPGSTMREIHLAVPVYSCEEAAAAKRIPLHRELKTLILVTSIGYVALHLPGDAQASLRKVKTALEVKEACLASPEQLREMDLEPGTVCAVREPVWSLPHLVSQRVFDYNEVSTNNGTHRAFYCFHPSVLRDSASVMIGDFEKM